MSETAFPQARAAQANFEYSIIGALCISPECIAAIQDKVAPEDFTIPACAEIYNTAKQAYFRGKPFDCVIAAGALGSIMPPDEANRFVAECMEITPTAANVEAHAEIVHRAAGAAALREAISVAQMETNPTVLATTIMDACRNFLEATTPRRMKTLSDALASMYGSKGHKEIRVDTGFQKLDRILKGMFGGNLVLLGARPAVGKTAFALSIARHVAEKGGKVLIYSYEMLAEELAERFVAQRGVPMDELIEEWPQGGDVWGEVSRAAATLSSLPIIINDDPTTTVAKMRAQAHAIKDLALIIIDFVTLMPSGKKFDNRNLEIGAISRNLKLLAAELKVPILALSQLNRDKNDTEMPTIRDLRDSGELEQNANKIILLWNLDIEESKVGVFVAKNRRGRTGTLAMRFDGRYMEFTELDDEVPRTAERKRRSYDED